MAWKTYSKKGYSKKLLDPRWQKVRLKILERDEWTCQLCFGDKETLHVHHLDYRHGAEPWEYEPHELLTLCWDCHGTETQFRPEAEALLKRAIRLRFLSGEIETLAKAIESLPRRLENPCLASALALVITDPNLKKEVLDRYSAHLDERKALNG